MTLTFDIADPRAARAAWTKITEPADPMAGLLLRVAGPEQGLRWLLQGGNGRKLVDQFPELEVNEKTVHHFSKVAERWQGRLEQLTPMADLAKIANLGGRFLIPSDPQWPVQLADLADLAPHGLWVLGEGNLGALGRSVALVGCRAATSYGVHVTTNLAHELVSHEVAVVSGGAYGIDAAAHRAALNAGGVTAAVLASGLDRWYPAGNHEIFRQMVKENILLGEAPPGAAPSRFRFLHRNRLIAALSGVTAVVEAAHRSGAISTANHALSLGRHLGAVPGPVTSIASEGCHRLLREGFAHCISDASHLLELLGPPLPGQGGLPLDIVAAEDAGPGAGKPGVTAGRRQELESLGQLPALVYENVPMRTSASAEHIASCAGLAVGETLGALGRLELHGFVRQVSGQWERIK